LNDLRSNLRAHAQLRNVAILSRMSSRELGTGAKAYRFPNFEDHLPPGGFGTKRALLDLNQAPMTALSP
jgi:hypothetical protein